MVAGTVKRVTAEAVELNDGSVVPYGLCVWSTGVGPTKFVGGLPFARSSSGRIAVNGACNVFDAATGDADPDVFALGDVAHNEDEPLPALAQVPEGVLTLWSGTARQSGLVSRRYLPTGPNACWPRCRGMGRQ